MAVFTSSEQAYAVMKTLLDRIKDTDPKAAQRLEKSRLILRLQLRQPDAAITINARRNPIEFEYGRSELRPDLELEVSADALHYILTGQMRFSKVLGSGQLKLHGPVWKAFVLEDLLKHLQTLYPVVLREFGITPPLLDRSGLPGG